MRRAGIVSVLLLLGAGPAAAGMITGRVVGPGTEPLAGAIVEVIAPGGERRCATLSAPDGRIALPCDAVGRHLVRASLGTLLPSEIGDVELGPDRSVELNFLLRLAANPAPEPSGSAAPDPPGFWTRPLPNPVVAHWGARPVTLRMLAIAAAPLAFVLGALTMLALGRRFGVEVRRLAHGEVGDLVLNPHRSAAGERLTPVAVVGARGAEATVSYGVREIVAALAARRYGLLLAALGLAPALFALAGLAFAFALLAGEEAYLFYAMLAVPAGFLLTPAIIAAQALRAARRRPATNA